MKKSSKSKVDPKMEMPTKKKSTMSKFFGIFSSTKKTKDDRKRQDVEAEKVDVPVCLESLRSDSSFDRSYGGGAVLDRDIDQGQEKPANIFTRTVHYIRKIPGKIADGAATLVRKCISGEQEEDDKVDAKEIEPPIGLVSLPSDEDLGEPRPTDTVQFQTDFDPKALAQTKSAQPPTPEPEDTFSVIPECPPLTNLTKGRPKPPRCLPRRTEWPPLPSGPPPPKPPRPSRQRAAEIHSPMENTQPEEWPPLPSGPPPPKPPRPSRQRAAEIHSPMENTQPEESSPAQSELDQNQETPIQWLMPVANSVEKTKKSGWLNRCTPKEETLTIYLFQKGAEFLKTAITERKPLALMANDN